MTEAKGNQMSQDAVAEIVKAFLADGNNRDMTKSDLVDLIGSVSLALNPKSQGVRVTAEAEVTKGTSPEASSSTSLASHVTQQQIDDSITDDAIYSFIDGKPYKALKRHLSTHGYTEKEYKEHFGLPANYPMVAKKYSESRSKLSKENGAGQNTWAKLANGKSVYKKDYDPAKHGPLMSEVDSVQEAAETPKTEKKSSKTERTPPKPKTVNDPTKEQAVG